MPATFSDLCQASTAKPAVQVLYTAFVGHAQADVSAYVISISPISRDAFLTAGNCTITLDNGSGFFDTFLDTAYELYGSVEISLYFPELPATFLQLFTGYVETVELGLDTITMRLRDRMSLCLDTVVGSSESPITYDGDYGPADIVWDVLVLKGGLSSIVNSTNPDIDYDGFVLWQAEMEDSGNEYHLNARFYGQTVGFILQRIMTLSNSVFWQNGLGKICFSPPQGAGSSIPFTKEYCIDRVFSVDYTGSVGNILCYYGLNTTTDVFAGSYNDSLASGTRAAVEVEEDRNIWHYTLLSATRYVTERLAKFGGGPVRTFTIPMWLVGFLSDISGVETLFNHYADPNNDIGITITDITFDLMSYEATLTGHWIWT